MSDATGAGVAVMFVIGLWLCLWVYVLLNDRDILKADRDRWKDRAKKEGDAEAATYKQLCTERRDWVAMLTDLAAKKKRPAKKAARK